jgi:hypothetical protein
MSKASWLKITANFNMEDYLDSQLYAVVDLYARDRCISMSSAAKELLARGLVYTRMTEGVQVKRGKRRSTLEKLTQRLEMARAIEDQEWAKVLEREVAFLRRQVDLMMPTETKDEPEEEPQKE